MKNILHIHPLQIEFLTNFTYKVGGEVANVGVGVGVNEMEILEKCTNYHKTQKYTKHKYLAYKRIPIGMR